MLHYTIIAPNFVVKYFHGNFIHEITCRLIQKKIFTNILYHKNVELYVLHVLHVYDTIFSFLLRELESRDINPPLPMLNSFIEAYGKKGHIES